MSISTKGQRPSADVTERHPRGRGDSWSRVVDSLSGWDNTKRQVSEVVTDLPPKPGGPPGLPRATPDGQTTLVSKRVNPTRPITPIKVDTGLERSLSDSSTRLVIRRPKDENPGDFDCQPKLLLKSSDLDPSDRVLNSLPDVHRNQTMFVT